MQTLMDKQQKYLVKKFHILLSKAGIGGGGKRDILSSYGVESSRDLTVHELLDVCNKLELMGNERAREEDKWRKRVIGVLFSWYRAIGKPTANMNMVKAVACRAAEADSFNAIPLERLRSLYYAFSKKTKDLEFVEQLTAEELDYSTWVN